MECKYCKNELKENEKFCKKCGRSQGDLKEINIKTLELKEHKWLKLLTNILAVIGAISIMALIFIAIMYYIYEVTATTKYIKIENNKIPTVYKVLNEKPEYVEEIDGKTYYTYNSSSLTRRDLVKYINALKKIGYKLANDTDGYINYYKDVKEDTILYISVLKTNKETTISYSKQDKVEVIENNNTDTKTVGNKKLGYITVSKDLKQNFETLEDAITFANFEYTNELNMYSYDKDLYTIQEVIEYEDNYLDETYDMYTERFELEDGSILIEGNNEDYGYYIRIYILNEEDQIKIISLVGTDKEDPFFEIIKTYRKN